MEISRLIAIRHGQTVSNVEDRVSGWHNDPPLTDLGLAQAAAAADSLGGRADQVFSSPKSRCVVTGQIAFGKPIPDKQQLEFLNERDYGRFDGRPNKAWKAFMATQPEHDDLGPDIETENDLIKRSLGAFMWLGAQRSDTIGVSTSGGIIRGLLLGTGHQLPTGAIDNLARLEVDYDGARLHVVFTDGIHFDT